MSTTLPAHFTEDKLDNVWVEPSSARHYAFVGVLAFIVLAVVTALVMTTPF